MNPQVNPRALLMALHDGPFENFPNGDTITERLGYYTGTTYIFATEQDDMHQKSVSIYEPIEPALFENPPQIIRVWDKYVTVSSRRSYFTEDELKQKLALLMDTKDSYTEKLEYVITGSYLFLQAKSGLIDCEPLPMFPVKEKRDPLKGKTRKEFIEYHLRKVA